MGRLGGGFFGASLIYLALLGAPLDCDLEADGEHHCSPLIADTRYMRLPTVIPAPKNKVITHSIIGYKDKLSKI